MLCAMLKVDALIEHIALAELRMLCAVDPAAATRKAKRMSRSEEDFVRGALPLVVPWLTSEVGADGPWVWSIGMPTKAISRPWRWARWIARASCR